MSTAHGARVIVVGGGVAGIVAALQCADEGAQVRLLEVRPRLGGAAYSVAKDGLIVDNGQHVFLRCCHAYRALLARLGSESCVQLQRKLEIPLLSPKRAPSMLRRSSLPAPAHLGRALLGFQALSLKERLRAAIAARALDKVDPTAPAADEVSFAAWLSQHGQSAAAIAELWDLVALPTLNVRAAQASLGLAAFVFQEGLLRSASAGDIGFHVKPLTQTLGEPALAALTQAGVEVDLRTRVLAIEPHAATEGKGCSRGFTVTASSGAGVQTLHCDAAIVALPHLRAAELLPPGAGPLADRIRQIGVSPIVNLHLVYDRKVTDLPFFAGVSSPVQYVFDRTSAGGAPAGCQYLAVSLSGAETEMSRSPEDLKERYVPALAALLPGARDAKLRSFFLTREHAATFKPSPGVGALRPGPRTLVEGLLLAGAWTATGWPATLESAAISGAAAAKAALESLERRGASAAPIGTSVT